MSIVLGNGLDEFAPITLGEINSAAALQRRFDRKYIVTPATLDRFFDLLGSETRVLEIDQRRTFGYRSTYFDTPDFDSYRGAAHRRPDRFKIRTRTYLSDENPSCWLEVKLRSRRGRTVKHRKPHDLALCDSLPPDAIRYLGTFTSFAELVTELDPVAHTTYDRTTLLHGEQRVTIDTGLVCSAGDSSAGLGDASIIETKSSGHPGAVDHALWSLGARPLKISKYAIGLAADHPELPTNKWHRTIKRYVSATGFDA